MDSRRLAFDKVSSERKTGSHQFCGHGYRYVLSLSCNPLASLLRWRKPHPMLQFRKMVWRGLFLMEFFRIVYSHSQGRTRLLSQYFWELEARERDKQQNFHG